MFYAQIFRDAGFPRTQYQAEILNDEHMIDAALCLHVPFDEIIHRIKDRWLHLPSGRVYNLSFNPPKVPVPIPKYFFSLLTGEPLDDISYKFWHFVLSGM